MSRVGLSTCSPLRAVLYEKFVISEFDPEIEVRSTSRSRKFVKFDSGSQRRGGFPYRGQGETLQTFVPKANSSRVSGSL